LHHSMCMTRLHVCVRYVAKRSGPLRRPLHPPCGAAPTPCAGIPWPPRPSTQAQATVPALRRRHSPPGRPRSRWWPGGGARVAARPPAESAASQSAARRTPPAAGSAARAARRSSGGRAAPDMVSAARVRSSRDEGVWRLRSNCLYDAFCTCVIVSVAVASTAIVSPAIVSGALVSIAPACTTPRSIATACRPRASA